MMKNQIKNECFSVKAVLMEKGLVGSVEQSRTRVWSYRSERVTEQRLVRLATWQKRWYGTARGRWGESGVDRMWLTKLIKEYISETRWCRTKETIHEILYARFTPPDLTRPNPTKLKFRRVGVLSVNWIYRLKTVADGKCEICMKCSE